ncbi:hypothetical protein DPMN_123254 [Dreissena polymorpha]|uniref:Uncharacterized protein n=1 Tax=Dreissena polymorpha TaxID=45954 RepID=A0A9D4GTY8_DREPO|nr:hypothetical protein DPMN_123254 [Dreissena polymorpha]
MYSSMTQGRDEHVGKRAETRRDEDLRYIVGLLLREQLIKVVGKRCHKAFQTLKKKSCS